MITFRDMEIEAEKGCSVFDTGDQLRDYVYRLSQDAMEEADRLELPDTDSVERRREYVKEHFLEAIGGLPQERPPLSPQVTGTVQCEGYRVDKVMFRSSERVWVSCSLYLPKDCGRRLAAVLFVCGHDPEGKQAPEYQRACIHLVKAGMAVLAMDSYGQGERCSYYDEACHRERIGRCTREHDYAGFQCMLLGDSVARYLLWDAMRAVDYLVGRPDIDASRIGITGNSGGGTLTMMMMIVDGRIAAAAPGTFVTSRRQYLQAGQAQDNEQIWPGLTRLGIDHRDGVLCMAPRPVLLLTAEHDFFPQKGTVETFAWCQGIWRLYGQEEKLSIYRDDCMHSYSEGMARRAAAFFAQYLGGVENYKADSRITPAILPPRKLWCSRTGYLTAQMGGDGIFEQNLARYRSILMRRGERERREETCREKERREEVCRERERWEETCREKERREEACRKRERREEVYGEDRCVKAASWLREQVFQNRCPKELYPRKIRETTAVLDLLCDSWIWEPQEGIHNHGFLFYTYAGENRDSSDAAPRPVTIALWRDGCARVTDHADFIRKECRKGRAVLVLDVTGMGFVRQREFLSWTDREGFYGAKFKLNDDLVWLGDCLAALGCFDVLRSLDLAEHLKGLKKDDFRLFACGRYSLYADIAALLDERIKDVSYEHPLEALAELVEDRFYDPLDMASFVIPGILKYGDIDDIRRWRKYSQVQNISIV